MTPVELLALIQSLLDAEPNLSATDDHGTLRIHYESSTAESGPTNPADFTVSVS